MWISNILYNIMITELRVFDEGRERPMFSPDDSLEFERQLKEVFELLVSNQPTMPI
jgi:hypothetical protein